MTIIDCARGSADAVLPAASRYFYYDRQTDAVYCIGYSSINVVDGQTSRIIWTLPTDLYFAGIASAPGWPCVYAAWNKHGVASGISAIHKAAGPADLAVRARPDAQATVVRGRLDWTGTLAVMYDKCGRRVADVHRGGNDLGRLRPGVYFVRQNDVRRGTYARKVIITR